MRKHIIGGNILVKTTLGNRICVLTSWRTMIWHSPLPNLKFTENIQQQQEEDEEEELTGMI